MKAIFELLNNIKEKSWCVRLADGFIDGNLVKSLGCQNCNSSSELLRVNYGNPNLLLYGCKDNKCKHRLLRLEVKPED